MEGQAWTVRVHGLGHQMPVWGAAQETQLAKDPKNPLSYLKKSDPEHIWKHFWNSSGGGALSGENVWVGTCRSGYELTDPPPPRLFIVEY